MVKVKYLSPYNIKRWAWQSLFFSSLCHCEAFRKESRGNFVSKGVDRELDSQAIEKPSFLC